MHLFVYEHVVGGGGWFDPTLLATDRCFLREGSAMLLAVAADLAVGSSMRVTTLCDERIQLDWPSAVQRVAVGGRDEFTERFQRCAAEADATLLIAPECGGILADLADRVEAAGGRLVGPRPELIRIASDKHASCEWLASRGVPTPIGRRIAAGEALPRSLAFPIVIKPCDGAGSTDVRRIEAWRPDLTAPPHCAAWRVESYVPGQPASCAVLCGPRQHVALPPCSQRLTDDGSFQYRGGRAPTSERLAVRARRLALQAASVLPEPCGYVGFDIVLGAAEDGSDDRVIEINPRLTTSYIGLRRLAGVNLAGAMLAVARGEPCALRFRTGPVEFEADGRTTLEAADES